MPAHPAYARAATACATLRVSRAPAGSRNRTLRDEAYSLGRLVGSGVLGADDAASALLVAAEVTGLGEREARSVVSRALRDGAQDPRSPSPGSQARVSLPPYRPHARRGFPPHEEVSTLWVACRSVVEDAEVCRWIAGRGLDPDSIELERLARALPAATSLPRWAWGPGGDWAGSGHRLIVPLYDAAGNLATLRARSVVTRVEPKSLAPAGHTTRGALMADLVGRALLLDERSEAWDGAVVVIEGEPDFMTWGSNRSDAAETVPAVFGIESGAWTEAVAMRIPSGARVAIRTHHDASGNAYADSITSTLKDRCRVFRSRQPEAR